MALTVTELLRRKGGIDPRGVRRYTKVYLIESDDPDQDPNEVDDALPHFLYDPYHNDSEAILKTIQVEGTDNQGQWMATLEWDSDQSDVDRGTTEPGTTGTPVEQGANQNATPPDQRPWVLKWGSVQTDEILVRDKSALAAPVVNSAGQPFDPPVVIQASHPTLSITAFRAAAQEEKILLFMNKVNLTEFLGWPADTARVTAYNITSVYEGGGFFWQVDITIEFKPDGWNPVRVLNAGTVELYYPGDTPAQLRAITDATGANVTTPVPLDENGSKLEQGAEVVYLEFRGYERTGFGDLI